MKKIVALAASFLLAAALVGCGCEHEYNEGTVTTEATCTKEGVKTYTCTLCGKEKQESIPCAPHKYVDGEIIKEPTCTEQGVKTVKCEVCGQETQENIPCIPHDYKENITKEATFESTGEKVCTCKVCGDTYTEVIPIRKDKVVVTVKEKKSVPMNLEQWIFSDRVEFKFTVENKTNKSVKGVSGVLDVKDLFGETIKSLNCDFTGAEIPPRGSATYSDLGVDINQFNSLDVKLYKQKFDDLKFEYSVSSIVYADGTSESFD